MKSEEEVFDTLREMLGYYESYRNTLNLSERDAAVKTLKTYEDFYQWLNEEK